MKCILLFARARLVTKMSQKCGAGLAAADERINAPCCPQKVHNMQNTLIESVVRISLLRRKSKVHPAVCMWTRLAVEIMRGAQQIDEDPE